MTQKSELPTLYSFRRCPYAMRARLALAVAQQDCMLREIVLRDKPDEMLTASPKGTVPVLILPDGTVIEESLEIMLWALSHNDPENWLEQEQTDQKVVLELIAHHDDKFKYHLDRYKYPNRYDGEDYIEHRDKAEIILSALEDRLKYSKNIMGDAPSLIDFSLFPFVRQFANVDRDWFDHTPLPLVQNWLAKHLESGLFLSIMKKYKPWKETGALVIFPEK